MKDDLIDCTGFEGLGVPTPLECWKHQAHQLACEVGELQKDLERPEEHPHACEDAHGSDQAARCPEISGDRTHMACIRHAQRAGDGGSGED
jgi:hypothetical protein